MSKNIGIWLRVSTEMQVETDSLEHHEQRARAYAESKGWNVLEVYNLSGVSGKTVMSHPTTLKMLEDIKSQKISALIFSKLARLARNTRELLDIADVFREHDAGLISLEESIDTTTPGGRLFFTMLAATTQFEREEIASRVQASVITRANLGKSLGGQAPFGYCWKEKKLVPDEKEAVIRKLMYELFDKHKRKAKVARLLNDMGYRTRGGAKFSDTSVDRLLRDTTAKGIHRRNFSKTRGKGLQWDLKDPSEWIFNEIEPIISEQLWDRCNNYLDQQRAKLSKAKSKTPKHLFSGILICHCGSKMYPYNSKSTYTCKSCKNKIPMLVIEEIFKEQLDSFVGSPDEIHKAVDQAREYLLDKKNQIQIMKSEVSNSKTQMDKVYNLYIDDKISADGFKEKYSPLEERVKSLEASIAEHEKDISESQLSKISAEGILNEGKNLSESWEKLDRESKRLLVENITEYITISENSINISFTYAPLLKQGKKSTQHHGLQAAINKNRAG